MNCKGHNEDKNLKFEMIYEIVQNDSIIDHILTTLANSHMFVLLY